MMIRRLASYTWKLYGSGELRTMNLSKFRAFTHAVKEQIVRLCLWPVPHYSRAGLYPQAMFITVGLIWFDYRPDWATQGPGVAMALLAFAAIYMGFRGPKVTRVEGTVWIAISACLFILEMHAISVDHATHDAEQALIRKNEESIRREQAKSFSDLISRGNKLLAESTEEKNLSSRNLELTAENLEHITGGDGYCWLTPQEPQPVVLGGDPRYQGGNWWQLGLRNSGQVVLPTCDLRFMPFPTESELKAQIPPAPPFLLYHFEKVPVIDRRHYRTTQYVIRGDRTYSGVIETPTRSFNEVITFAPDPNNPVRYVPSCTVSEQQSGKVLENECNPQK